MNAKGCVHQTSHIISTCNSTLEYKNILYKNIQNGRQNGRQFRENSQFLYFKNMIWQYEYRVISLIF